MNPGIAFTVFDHLARLTHVKLCVAEDHVLEMLLVYVLIRYANVKPTIETIDVLYFIIDLSSI